MIDSMNARHRLIEDRTKMSYNDFRMLKKMLKEELIDKNANIVTSDYFQNFDTDVPKNMNDKQSYYLEIAAKVAMKSEMNHKHGAILVHKKQVIASGYNYYCGDHSIHAEIAVISQIKGKMKKCLPDCELYVVRIGPNKFHDHLKYSRPCCNCQNYITKKFIKKTYYSTNYQYDITIDEYLKAKKEGLC